MHPELFTFCEMNREIWSTSLFTKVRIPDYLAGIRQLLNQDGKAIDTATFREKVFDLKLLSLPWQILLASLGGCCGLLTINTLSYGRRAAPPSASLISLVQGYCLQRFSNLTFNSTISKSNTVLRWISHLRYLLM